MFDGSATEKLQQEWNKKGTAYAKAVNEMVSFGEQHGWENWKGKEPEDKRAHLGDQVIQLLRDANNKGAVKEFRAAFSPALVPLAHHLKKQSQSISDIHFIEDGKIVFLTGAPYEERQAYMLDNDNLTKLDEAIYTIGKSKQGNIFAVERDNTIVTTRGWQGDLICEFTLHETADVTITELIPFNDGRKLLLVSSEGIFIINEKGEERVHPVNEGNEKDWTPGIAMENAALSHNNDFVVVGDQGSDHRVLNNEGREIGMVGPQSSYPHFCLFSKDDEQLITNSCHFYNGITIGVKSDLLNGLKIEAYTKSDKFVVIDQEMRVYAGLSTADHYILGDAYGYIRAMDKQGNKLWRHYVGSTITGMAISDDETTLWVGAASGILHKLKLQAGQDEHTIGNGNHREEFRLFLWKDEPKPLFW
ncbi:hypothetical protein [Chitinophaga filiformis]|uniref:PQQ-like domain-containing protein n=1 Tax=Chitinophaga filiformis TaxID=104663 RepID=A0A1G7NZ81_CHIFI|nr:hypothetical protein [Chitinophaga filiformis]SDF79365.1 hypothetical protein SAMN04488121_1021004 [Chitinophaga filiformis]